MVTSSPRAGGTPALPVETTPSGVAAKDVPPGRRGGSKLPEITKQEQAPALQNQTSLRDEEPRNVRAASLTLGGKRIAARGRT